MGRSRNARADRTALGSYVQASDDLAELDALLTARLASVARLTMLRQDFLALETVVMVVMNLSVLGRFFLRICVVLSHADLLLKTARFVHVKYDLSITYA
jgi:hypothetical protein